ESADALEGAQPSDLRRISSDRVSSSSSPHYQRSRRPLWRLAAAKAASAMRRTNSEYNGTGTPHRSGVASSVPVVAHGASQSFRAALATRGVGGRLPSPSRR